ncbi:MAG: hypothetical protein K0R98_1612 [Rickettsiaceae bacterium]|jgi:hypothetical protein|nr:hypothetical protein [Gammaproteobacteria bacterium]MCE3233355.1 hypothetical protein [Rickettsiaceae bacterium]
MYQFSPETQTSTLMPFGVISGGESVEGSLNYKGHIEWSNL